jgi:hypothetical protein
LTGEGLGLPGERNAQEGADNTIANHLSHCWQGAFIRIRFNTAAAGGMQP